MTSSLVSSEEQYDSLAPIALFAFNRPQHLHETLKSLKANDLAALSDLHIFVDGPRSSSDLSAIAKVKSIIENISGFNSVHTLFRSQNIGLEKSITRGVTELIQESGKIIVLEDDIVTSHGFLRFMNEALNFYENEPRVFQVTGYMVPNVLIGPQTGFLRIISSWGWGTWSTAWGHYQSDANSLLSQVREKGEEAFNLDCDAYHSHDLERNANNELSTWAVKWYASVFLEDGLCLYPRQSMLRNIGFDGSGTNCGEETAYTQRRFRLASGTKVKKIVLEENSQFLIAMQKYYSRQQQRWTESRLVDRIRRKIKQVIR